MPQWVKCFSHKHKGLSLSISKLALVERDRLLELMGFTLLSNVSNTIEEPCLKYYYRGNNIFTAKKMPTNNLWSPHTCVLTHINYYTHTQRKSCKVAVLPCSDCQLLLSISYWLYACKGVCHLKCALPMLPHRK